MFAVQGSIVRCLAFGTLQIQDELLVVDSDTGKILAIHMPTGGQTCKHGNRELQVHKLKVS
jgi:hypothetical protein